MFFTNFLIFIGIFNCVTPLQILDIVSERIKSVVHHKEYNPDEYLTVPEIIARHGYQSETHVVTTADGYIIQIHRIPGAKNASKRGQPVYLQHGLLGSSSDWIINGNNSLAFLLADRGYDVWLGNARGNTYSKGHIHLPVDSPQFWNFSWHEMGIYDLPAALYHVGNTTGKNGDIIYIGHSMGTTMFFVLSSVMPEVARTVKMMTGLAPVGYMTHITSPIKYMAPFSGDIQWLAKYLGLNQFLPNDKLLKFLAYDCELLHIDQEICENVIFVLCGYDKNEFNQNILRTVFNKYPAGTSTKTIVHYAQEIYNGGNFEMFDYGPVGNQIQYGDVKPPKYDVSNVNTPVFLMYANNDLLANDTDVKFLASKLSHLVGLYDVPMDSFNHVDFLFGKDAERLVYEPILNVLKNFTGF